MFGLDQNYVDATGIGGAPSGHKQVVATCGGGESGLQARLKAIGNSGEAMLAAAAAKGAKQPDQTRNVLVLQHYPGVCDSLKKKFVGSLPEGEVVDFRCSFGRECAGASAPKIAPRCGRRDVAEIWPRFGRDLAEIWPRLGFVPRLDHRRHHVAQHGPHKGGGAERVEACDESPVTG